jgi:putative endonuclease
MFFIYALYSEESDKIYIGFSHDPNKRLLEHNEERNTGWTQKFRPWKLIYTEKCESKTVALIREKQLKSSRGRDFVWSLIAGNKTHFEH